MDTEVADFDLVDLRQAFRLNDTAAKLLDALLREKTLTYPMIKDLIGAEGVHAHTALFRLRQRMEVYGIVIVLMRGTGYYLTAPMKNNALALLHQTAPK